VERDRRWTPCWGRCTIWNRTRWRGIFLGGLDNFIIQQIKCCAEDDPFYAVLVALSQGLPDGLFLGRFSCDAYSSSTTVWTRWILLYLSKLDALWGYVVTSIGKVEHAPEGSIGVGL